MTKISIYDPRVKKEAEANGITQLQAWRKLIAQQELSDRRKPNLRGQSIIGRRFGPRDPSLLLVTWEKGK